MKTFQNIPHHTISDLSHYGSMYNQQKDIYDSNTRVAIEFVLLPVGGTNLGSNSKVKLLRFIFKNT